MKKGLLFLIVNVLLSIFGLHTILNAQINVKCIKTIGGEIFAGTNDGIYISADNGINWQRSSDGMDPKVEVTTIGHNKSGVFAGTYQHGLYASTNNGKTWNSITNLPENFVDKMINEILVTDSSIFIASWAGIIVSFDNAKSWNPADKGIKADNYRSIISKGPFLYTGTFDKGIYMSSDNGKEWSKVNIGANNIPTMEADDTAIYAGSYKSGAFISYNDGKKWEKINSLKAESVFSFLRSGSNIFGATAEQGLFVSSDNTKSWSKIDLDVFNETEVMAIEANSTGILVGTYVGIFLISEKGNKWEVVKAGLNTPRSESSTSTISSTSTNTSVITKPTVTSSSSSSTETQRYCYTAVIENKSGNLSTSIWYSAQFLQITAPSDANEDSIKDFARDYIKSALEEGSIIEESLDLNKECSDCKSLVSESYTLSNFQINRVTMGN